MTAAGDDAAATVRPRLRRGFRSGVLSSHHRGEYRPFVTIGIARDGGVFAIPAAVGGSSWTHGPLSPGVSEPLPGTHVTAERPKLHYHRSGIVRASLSGTDLPASTSNFQPLHTRGATTFMSVVVTLPGEFPVRELRRGDDATIEGGWPTVTGLAFAVVSPRARSATFDKDSAPMGLVDQTPSQVAVELGGYGHSLLVLSQVSSTFDPLPDGMGPSVTVAAFDEPEADGGPRIHALWSTTSRNPMLYDVRNFLWEADRGGDVYRDGYVRRFGRLPPWDQDSGTSEERHVVERILATPRPPGEQLHQY